MTPHDARTMENNARNPGLTPMDDAADTNREANKHEPDRTTGRLPERAEKSPRWNEKKPRQTRDR
jgi:hypothetical protein